MNVQRLCWRRSLRQPAPSCVRRKSQAAYAAARHSYARGLVGPSLEDEDAMRQNGILDLIAGSQGLTPRPGGQHLYSPQGFQVAWCDYQKKMIDRINELTAERPLFGRDVKSILLATSRDPLNAALFNHASMAFNNHFYFQNISSRGSVPMPQRLGEKFVEDFSSLENLRDSMLAAAYSMFGPGFVWLVRTKLSVGAGGFNADARQFKILTTYLAGSPLAGAHNRRQPLDMNTQNVGTAEAAGSLRGLSEDAFRRQTEVQNSVGTMGSHARSMGMPTSFGGVEIEPCLCVNTWEHAYMFDFTINGKMEFLNRWWNLVNWRQVARLSGVEDEKEATVGTSRLWQSSESRFQRT